MITEIAVVGAGVVGLSCAVQIAEYFKDNHNIHVCLLSEEFSPSTTSDGAAGLWGPYMLGDTPPDQIIKWSTRSHEFFHELWKSGQAAEAGICLQPVTSLTTSSNGENPIWTRVVYGCSQLTYEQLDNYSKEHSRNYTGGVNFVTFSCEPAYFLPYLKQRFASAGGKVFKKRVNHFDELKESYDIIINCTGLGAQTLINDSKMIPIRGQIVRVQAPWNFQSFLDDEYYIICNMESVVLGGTHQENDCNRNISSDDTNFIMNGCQNILPTLRHATLIKEWVGLRPGRSTVRIEEEIFAKKNGTIGKLIHNYGHGGSGITLAWGCATDVLDLVKKNAVSNVKSKL